MARATTQTDVNEDKPTHVYVSNFSLNDSGSIVYQYSGECATTRFSGCANWNTGDIGTASWGSQYQDNYSLMIDDELTISWSETNSTTRETYNYHWSGGDYGFTNITTDGLAIFSQFCDVNTQSSDSVGGDFWNTTRHRILQSQLKLQTGGKALSKQNNLIRLTGAAGKRRLGDIQLAFPFAFSGWYVLVDYSGTGYGNMPTNMSISNLGSFVGGILYASLPDNVDLDITPSIPNVDYYGFGISANKVQTKQDWQGVVRDEIDSDSGVTIENYQASNGFMNNRTNIQAVYSFYQKMFTERPTQFYWTGLAKLAGAPVYAGLSDAEYLRRGLITSGFLDVIDGFDIAADILSSKAAQFQTNLIGMNIAVYSDLSWQFEAYRKIGLSALEEVNAGDPNAFDIGSWRTIDQGIQQNNVTNIQTGNQLLLQREQQRILAQGYIDLGNLFPVTTSVMSILAQNPVLGGPRFSLLEPSGNIANFSDRWDWITRTYTSSVNTGMLPLWLHESPSVRLQDVGQSLLSRAQSGYSLAYAYFGLTIY